jgi:hypothetical protein
MSWSRCSIEGCDSTRRGGHGWCRKHYQRWKRNGDPLLVRRIIGDDDARFWSQVRKTEHCWIWTGHTHRGYGYWNLGGTPRATHRYPYETIHGAVPKELHLDHLCHTWDRRHCPGGDECPHRRCVNPDHLEPVTPAVNALRSNSLPALNAEKTHCGKGHAFSPENTYVTLEGWRKCRTCERETNREATRRYKAKKRAERASKA